MDGTQLLVTLIGTGGGGAVLLALTQGIMKWLSGAAGREQKKNTDLVSQRKEAIEEAKEKDRLYDDEAKKRRKAEEYASLLRRQYIEATGKTPAPWPTELDDHKPVED